MLSIHYLSLNLYPINLSTPSLKQILLFQLFTQDSIHEKILILLFLLFSLVLYHLSKIVLFSPDLSPTP